MKQTTRTMRSQQLDDLLYSVTLGKSPVSRAARATAKTLAPRELRRDTLRRIRRAGVLGPAPAPDETLMRELRVRFKPEVVALSEYLDRDLVALWGYGDLG